MRSLFIGRFQPFHLGHLDAVRQILSQSSQVIIAVGSAEANFRPVNPLTAGERVEMIETALKEAKIPAEKYLIIPIANINNYALWPAYVDLFVPPYERMYTRSDTVECLYQNYNLKLKKPYQIVKLRQKRAICSTDIRNAMLKNKKWEHMVPKSTVKLLKNWKIQNRLKTIQEAEK